MAAFTRVQESTADQIALKLLLATHQSPHGHVSTPSSASRPRKRGAPTRSIPYAVDHPVGPGPRRRYQDRRGSLALSRCEGPPAGRCIPSRWCRPSWPGFVLPVKEALNRYPESDTSEPARYARAMVYLRQPQLHQGAGRRSTA